MLPDNGTYFSKEGILAVKDLFCGLERFVYENEKNISCS